MENANILVCEDECLVAKDIQRSLKIQGYSVAGIAASGREALEVADQHRPNLALMDIRIKGPLDGIETAQLLKEQFNIPSIFLTAYADDTTLANAKVAEPLGYLLKPFKRFELRTTIETGLYRFNKQQQLIETAHTHFIDPCSMTELVECVELFERNLANIQRRDSHSRILTKIGHTLRQELNVLGILLKRLGVDDTLSESQIKRIRGALIRYESLSEFANELLQTSKPNELDLSEIDIKHLLMRAMKNFSETLETSVSFATGFAEQSLVVSVDNALVEKLFCELFRNAVDSMQETPVIAIETSREFENYPERSNPKGQRGWYVSIQVTDFGPGIASEMQPHLFEPFFTQSNRLDAEGMGLLFVDQVAREHGGWVEVKSDEGGYTAVTVYLPEVRSEVPQLLSSMHAATLAISPEEPSVVVVVGSEGTVGRVKECLGSEGTVLFTFSEINSAVDWCGRQEGVVDSIVLRCTSDDVHNVKKWIERIESIEADIRIAVVVDDEALQLTLEEQLEQHIAIFQLSDDSSRLSNWTSLEDTTAHGNLYKQ